MRLEGFSQEVIEELQYYVYAYIDPRNNEVFYVGKGKGNRVFEKHNEETEKRIEEIQIERKDVIRKIVRYGMHSEKTAYEVEAVLIDFIGKNNLTNEVNGHYSNEICTVEEFEKEYKLEKIDGIDEKIILIKLTNSFDEIVGKENFNQLLYERTRKCWRIAKERASKAQYVFSVHNNKVVEVYKIYEWKEVTEENYRDFADMDENCIGRCFFNGEVAEDSIRDKYINRKISEFNGQNPIKYVNC